MFADTVDSTALAAARKFEALKLSVPRYLVMSALAGAYIGLGIALIFALGAPLSKAGSPFLKPVMGVSFGVALTLVIFCGSELFTGNAMSLMIGALTGKSSWKQLGAVWSLSYLGNLLGALSLAWLLAQSGVLSAEPAKSFVETAAAAKMHLDFGTAFARGILANWLVCLAVWGTGRTKSDPAKLVIIFWCLFAFIGAGFEHSVANMTLLALALFQPHAGSLSWLGYVQNLVPVTLGNIVGGAVFVGAAYWFSSQPANAAPAEVVPVFVGEGEAAQAAT